MSFGLPKKYDEFRKSIHGQYGDAQNGFVIIPQKGLQIQFSNGFGWEHVSVSKRSKMPTYEEICWVRQIMWGGNELVMQLFVPTEEHIDCHPYCLHLWRPSDENVPIPQPPPFLIA